MIHANSIIIQNKSCVHMRALKNTKFQLLCSSQPCKFVHPLVSFPVAMLDYHCRNEIHQVLVVRNKDRVIYVVTSSISHPITHNSGIWFYFYNVNFLFHTKSQSIPQSPQFNLYTTCDTYCSCEAQNLGTIMVSDHFPCPSFS